jgi:hypothetical protein
MATQVLKIVNFGSAKGGLATVGYKVYNPDGSVAYDRSTAGVVEIGTSTGIYSAKVTINDADAIVLWDTGEGTPRYATEDYQSQVGRIEGQTARIEQIWNSLRNQGEFFSTLMDKMGVLEKNEGLKKLDGKIDSLAQRDTVSLTNIEEAFKNATGNIKLNVPETKIPDYSSVMAGMESKVTSLKSEIDKIPKTQRDYSTYFNNLNKHLANISDYFASVKVAFTKFDSIISKVESLNTKLDSLDVNDKEFIRTKDKVVAEIQRLNQFVHLLSSSSVVKDFQDANNMLYAFGHKRGK